MKLLYILIFILLNVTTLLAQLHGQAKIDSLLKELPTMKEDTNGVILLNNISSAFSKNDALKGIKYGKKSAELSNKLKWKRGQASAYLNLAYCYFRGNINSEKVIEYGKQSNKIYTSIGDKSGIASTYVLFGNLYEHKSNFPKSLEYSFKALKIYEELGLDNSICSVLINIGVIYNNQEKNDQALEIYFKALSIIDTNHYQDLSSSIYNNIAIVYKNKNDINKALEYYHKAYNLNKEAGNKINMVTNLTNLGSGYRDLYDFEHAMLYYNLAKEIVESTGNKRQLAFLLGNIGILNITITKIDMQKKINSANEFISFNNEIRINKGIDYLTKALDIAEEQGDLYHRSQGFDYLSNAYTLKGDYKKALEAKIESYKFKDSVFNQENNDKISALEKLREDDLNRLQIEKQEILLKAKEDEKQLILISAGGALIAVLIILTLIINQRRKSEKLLLNILPASIAKRLKAKEENIADDFETATTIFIDLVGFTSFAKDKEASEVVELLNNIFHRFDSLANKHGLEKIKTMGDGYLAVSGVPEPDTNHCQKAINFALDIYNELEKFNKEMGLDINARIGLETGPVVAGVIGSSKFIYDIWGDSVNTASRMESTGTPGKIQITENVKAELEKQETNFQFEKREPFEVKGKGLMQTYFLD